MPQISTLKQYFDNFLQESIYHKNLWSNLKTFKGEKVENIYNVNIEEIFFENFQNFVFILMVLFSNLGNPKNPSGFESRVWVEFGFSGTQLYHYQE